MMTFNHKTHTHTHYVSLLGNTYFVHKTKLKSLFAAVM